jgi:cob(I)alamin adenosyltransferase
MSSDRLSRITTRTGDTGTTGLADGSRIAKTHSRIQALGDVDELNTCVGVWRTYDLPPPMAAWAQRIQQELFNLGGELAYPGSPRPLLTAQVVTDLEEALAHDNAQLEPLKEFILPGGTPAASWAHMVRTVARRAERSVAALNEANEAAPFLPLIFLNRLSDLFFVWARVLNQNPSQTSSGTSSEVYWQSPRLNP